MDEKGESPCITDLMVFWLMSPVIAPSEVNIVPGIVFFLSSHWFLMRMPEM